MFLTQYDICDTIYNKTFCLYRKYCSPRTRSKLWTQNYFKLEEVVENFIVDYFNK